MIISVKADFKILEVMLYNNNFTTKSPKGNH